MFPRMESITNLWYTIFLLFILQVLETVVTGIENMGGESLLLSLIYHVYSAYILNEPSLFIILILHSHISEAFCSMMTGGNVGKQVVKISD